VSGRRLNQVIDAAGTSRYPSGLSPAPTDECRAMTVRPTAAIDAPPGESLMAAGQPPNHRDLAMTHHTRAVEDPVANHRTEENEIHV